MSLVTPLPSGEPAPAGAGSAGWARTSRSDYLLRLALELARPRDGGALVKARDLAASTAIPRSYIAGILGSLIHAGLVEARAGPQGGYRLARAPGTITVLDVLDADPPSGPARCIIRGGRCSEGAGCPMHAAWADAENAFRDRLRAQTLAGLLGRA